MRQLLCSRRFLSLQSHASFALRQHPHGLRRTRSRRVWRCSAWPHRGGSRPTLTKLPSHCAKQSIHYRVLSLTVSRREDTSTFSRVSALCRHKDASALHGTTHLGLTGKETSLNKAGVRSMLSIITSHLWMSLADTCTVTLPIPASRILFFACSVQTGIRTGVCCVWWHVSRQPSRELGEATILSGTLVAVLCGPPLPQMK
jgi:hypothetical protein